MSPPTTLPVLAATTAAQTLVSLAMLAPAAIAPEIARDLGVPGALIGWWISIAYGGAMVTSLLGGGAVRRLGATRTTQAALGLVALGALATASAWLPLLVLGAALCGLGYGLTNPAASHLLARSTNPANRNLMFSVKQTGVPLGGTLAGLTIPGLALAFGWPMAIGLIAILCVTLAAILTRVRGRWDADRDPNASLNAHPIAGLGLIWRSPLLRALSLTGFAYAAVQLSLSTFLVTMLVGDLRWSLVESGLLLSSVQIAGVVGRLLVGTLADRWLDGVRTLIGLGIATALLALTTGLLGPSWPVALVFVVLVPFGAAALGWNGIYLAELAHAAGPSQIPRVTGASLFFTYGGVLVGPPSFAALHGLVGSYTATYALAAIPAVVGVVLLARMRGRKQV